MAFLERRIFPCVNQVDVMYSVETESTSQSADQSHLTLVSSALLDGPNGQRAAGSNKPVPGVVSRAEEFAATILKRLGFGPCPGDTAAFIALGSSDAERLAVFLELQLQPEWIREDDLHVRLQESGLKVEEKSPSADPELPVQNRLQAIQQADRIAILRALYSRRQVLERLTGFWHRQFRVDATDPWIAPSWTDLNEKVIRANAMGNYRRLLMQLATSVPLLLHYVNPTACDPAAYNNFVGILFNGDEPTALAPLGTESDVLEAARCFTGWTVDYLTEQFHYSAECHDRDSKQVFGQTIPGDQAPMQDGCRVLDLIAHHPETAQRVAWMLCREFVADDPPPSVVSTAAAIFLEQRFAADQLKQVIQAIVLSPEFNDSKGLRHRRPFEMAIGSLRALGTDLHLPFNDSSANWLVATLIQTSDFPVYHHTPDHLEPIAPLTVERIHRGMRVAHQRWQGRFRFFNVIAETPANLTRADEIGDYWIARILGKTLDAAKRDQFLEKLSDPHWSNASLQLEVDPAVQDRLQSLVMDLLLSKDNKHC